METEQELYVNFILWWMEEAIWWTKHGKPRKLPEKYKPQHELASEWPRSDNGL